MAADRTIEFDSTERYGFLWLKKRRVTRRYRGSGTVWHSIQTGERPVSSVEAKLSEMDWILNQSDALDRLTAAVEGM